MDEAWIRNRLGLFSFVCALRSACVRLYSTFYSSMTTTIRNLLLSYYSRAMTHFCLDGSKLILTIRSCISVANSPICLPVTLLYKWLLVIWQIFLSPLRNANIFLKFSSCRISYQYVSVNIYLSPERSQIIMQNSYLKDSRFNENETSDCD